MPKSRRRKTAKHPGRKDAADLLALDRMFDGVANRAFACEAPPVVYHYTSWAGAEGILSTQTVWATAHDCTNDPAELVSADAVILDVARELRVSAAGLAAYVLDLFVEHYLEVQVTKVVPVFIFCVSAARDDEQQWQKYGDAGRGVCLGIRILDEPPPRNSGVGCATLRVDYAADSWRETVTTAFNRICALLAAAKLTRRNAELSLNALYRIAAFASISAKKPEWASEREMRHVALVRNGGSVDERERISAGRTIRYLAVRLRRPGKLVSLAEFIVGPNDGDHAASVERARRLLEGAGYRPGRPEYPSILLSAVTDRTAAGPSTERSSA